jgi:hypothetical protein
MYKLILSANEIPFGSTVTKKTGEKKYTLREKIVVYNGSKIIAPMEIKAEPGVAFIVSENGDVNAIEDSTELVWLAEREDIIHRLSDAEDEE